MKNLNKSPVVSNCHVVKPKLRAKDDQLVDYKDEYGTSSLGVLPRYKYPPPRSWNKYKNNRYDLGVLEPVSINRRGIVSIDHSCYASRKPRDIYRDIDESTPSKRSERYYPKTPYKAINTVVQAFEEEMPDMVQENDKYRKRREAIEAYDDIKSYYYRSDAYRDYCDSKYKNRNQGFGYALMNTFMKITR